MPTYEYQCQTCGSVFDVSQSIKAAPLRRVDCTKCGKPRQVKRLISAGGAVLFKGAGFYQTDYRSTKYKDAAKAESGSSDKSEAKSDIKTDTKPTTKTDAKTDAKSGESAGKKSESTASEKKAESKREKS